MVRLIFYSASNGAVRSMFMFLVLLLVVDMSFDTLQHWEPLRLPQCAKEPRAHWDIVTDTRGHDVKVARLRL